MVLVATIFEQAAGAPFFCIDSYFEAETLRHAGIKTPLLVIGHTPAIAIAKSARKHISFMVGSLEQLGALAAEYTGASVHLKFDTGMHRQGIPFDRLDDAVRLMKNARNVHFEGACSHFADADSPRSAFTAQQIARWNKIAMRLQKDFPAIRFYHIANSAGFAYHDSVIANVGRPGIALYGWNPGNLAATLHPTLRMRSVVSEIHEIAQGEHVGYGGAFTADYPMKIATVPVGYYEGVDRRFSPGGTFIVRGKPAPLVGRVSMNISVCDITSIKGATLGDAVTVISDNPDDPNSAGRIAERCGTIPYEILVRIPAHLHRTVAD